MRRSHREHGGQPPPHTRHDRIRPPSSGPPWWPPTCRRPTSPLTRPVTTRTTSLSARRRRWCWSRPCCSRTWPWSPVASTTSCVGVHAGGSRCRRGAGSMPDSRATRTTACCCSGTGEPCTAARHRHVPCRTRRTGHSPSVHRPGTNRPLPCASPPSRINPSHARTMLSRGMSAGTAANCNGRWTGALLTSPACQRSRCPNASRRVRSGCGA